MEDIIEQLEQETEQGWDIYDALEESTTETEAHPPVESRYDRACVPLSVTVSDSISSTIRHVQSEFGFSSKSQSAQRILRYGLQEIQDPNDSELKEALNKNGDCRDVIDKYVTDVGEAKFGFGALRETQALNVDYGWDTKNRAESYSIFWNQKEIIRWQTDQLRVPDSDIFQWGIINGKVEMGNEGLLNPDEARRAEETRKDITDSIKRRYQFTRAAALDSIWRAYQSDRHERVANYCSRKVPELWEEFEKRTFDHNKGLEENDPIYGNPFMYGGMTD